MNCARNQLLSGAALSTDQDGRIRRRHPRKEPIDLLHAVALANHVVLQIDFRRQPQVFLFQPQQPARIFERHSGDAGDAGHKFQVVTIKTGNRVGRVQINAANHPLKDGQGNAEQRTHLEAGQALHSAQSSAAGYVSSQDRNPLFHYLPGDGSTHSYRLLPA